jgi:hypothetical protein
LFKISSQAESENEFSQTAENVTSRTDIESKVSGSKPKRTKTS